MFAIGVIVCACVFVLSLIFCFAIGDNIEDPTWPFKLCTISLVIGIICMVGDVYTDYGKVQDRYGYICHFCNKVYKTKDKSNLHVVKVSPFKEVFVCDKCFNSAEQQEEQNNE